MTVSVKALGLKEDNVYYYLDFMISRFLTLDKEGGTIAGFPAS